MAYIEAERFAALKARVKAECLRRCHTGSVAEYGGESYDYENAPVEDHTIDVEHYEKLALPLSKIHSEKVPGLDGHRIVFAEDVTAFESALTLFEARPMTDKTQGDCETSCTGACYTGCSSACTGSCDTTCSTECQGECTGCRSGCANSCTSSCKNECYGCGSDCTGGCSGSCELTCATGCIGSCAGECKKTCTQTCGNEGCCLSLCYNGCRASCQKNCGYCGTTCEGVST